MLEEFNALLVNDTWSLVPKQSHFNIIGNKWVFRPKRNPNDSIARYKTRLVAKEFHQHPGINYTKTYSPVINLRLSSWFFALLYENLHKSERQNINKNMGDQTK